MLQLVKRLTCVDVVSWQNVNSEVRVLILSEILFEAFEVAAGKTQLSTGTTK